MPSAQDMLNAARSHLGEGGSATWAWYNNNVSYAGTGWAWCAAFQSRCAAECGLSCRYSASAAGFATQFTRVKDEDVQPGDIVVFNWDGRTDTGWCDHVAIVESFDHGTGWFYSIDGNSGTYSETTSYVKRCHYNNNDTSMFTAFYRPNYGGSKPTPKPTPTGFFYQVYTDTWLDPVSTANPNDPNGYAGWEDKPIYGVRCSLPIQVHLIGYPKDDWLSWVKGTSQEGDDFAGEDLWRKIPIDGIRVKGGSACAYSRGWFTWYTDGQKTAEGDDFAGDYGHAITRVMIKE